MMSMPQAPASASPPLPPGSARLLSDMGMRPGRTSGQPTFHAGMDLGHPGGAGTPVLNVRTGIVEHVIRDDAPSRGFRGYGNAVVVRHSDDTWALYAHLRSVAVHQGQVVAPGQRIGTMGNTSNGKFSGMGVHLHLELRRPRRDGGSPFPGPYRVYNLNPRPWLEEKGLHFGSRGAFEIVPGSPMSLTRPLWSQLGIGGVDPYPESLYQGRRLPETALAGEEEIPENTYEPPARFDRDVRFGLTPVEWAAAGAGALVLVGTAVAVVLRYRLRSNRHRRRLRRRTSRRLADCRTFR